MPEPASPPSLYEWAGGMPTLQRLTAHFYDRVRGDPMLAPVFAQMGGEHPRYVAQFIAVDDPRWGARNNPDAERRIADLLAAWRATGRPVTHVQHLSLEPQSPLREDAPGHAFKVEALPMPGEPVFRKHVNSAFIGTDLEAHLRANGIEALVVVGITTDHCVSTTARMAGNPGFTVTVVEDATATFERRGSDGTHYSADLMHRVALASLHGEFATVRSAQDILAAVGA